MSKKNNQPEYFTGKNHDYYCVLTTPEGETFTGKAVCAEADYEFESETVGFTIAESRALLQYLRRVRDSKKNQLKALKHLLHSCDRSKYYNPKNYMERRLFSHIHLLEDDIEAVNQMISFTKANVFEYLNSMNAFHKSVKERRASTNSESNQDKNS